MLWLHGTVVKEVFECTKLLLPLVLISSMLHETFTKIVRDDIIDDCVGLCCIGDHHFISLEYHDIVDEVRDANHYKRSSNNGCKNSRCIRLVVIFKSLGGIYGLKKGGG